MNSDLVDLLRRIAGILSQFTEVRIPGALAWDGQAYVHGSQAMFDPGAAKWWGMLTGIAAMLERQPTPLAPEQAVYLSHLLGGGMGSLNDFEIDQGLGASAVKANTELTRLKAALIEQFGDLTSI